MSVALTEAMFKRMVNLRYEFNVVWKKHISENTLQRSIFLPGYPVPFAIPFPVYLAPDELLSFSTN